MRESAAVAVRVEPPPLDAQLEQALARLDDPVVIADRRPPLRDELERLRRILAVEARAWAPVTASVDRTMRWGR